MIALIWDMDGVLVDSRRAHYEAWKHLFDAIGKPLTPEQVAETLGMSNEPILRRWLGPDTPLETVHELADRKEAWFRELVAEHVRTLPGAVELLRAAQSRGYRQAVASSAPMANIVRTVECLGLSDYFALLISGARLPNSKPDPAIFVNAAAGLGVEPTHSVVLEDSVVGVEAAVRAEMHCIAVTTTRPADDLVAADRIVDSLADLPPKDIEQLVNS